MVQATKIIEKLSYQMLVSHLEVEINRHIHQEEFKEDKRKLKIILHNMKSLRPSQGTNQVWLEALLKQKPRELEATPTGTVLENLTTKEQWALKTQCTLLMTMKHSVSAMAHQEEANRVEDMVGKIVIRKVLLINGINHLMKSNKIKKV